jgi:hypothetical protein
VFLIMFKQGTRYPFAPKVSPSAKQSRCIRRTGTRYESLTATNATIPRTGTVRKQNADAAYTCSANNRCPRSDRGHWRGHKQSTSANASRFQQSGNRHWQWTQTVRSLELSIELSMPANSSRSRILR